MPEAFELTMRHISSPWTAGSRVNVPYQALSEPDRAFVDAWRNGQSAGDSNPR
jgi:hypothetical protein